MKPVELPMLTQGAAAWWSHIRFSAMRTSVCEQSSHPYACTRACSQSNEPHVTCAMNERPGKVAAYVTCGAGFFTFFSCGTAAGARLSNMGTQG